MPDEIDDRQPLESRSERFVMHYQLAALADSLRLLCQIGSEPSDPIFELVKKLHADTHELTRGRALTPELVPDPDGSLADWLVITTNLLAISTAFLTPEERTEVSRIGFHAER